MTRGNLHLKAVRLDRTPLGVSGEVSIRFAPSTRTDFGEKS